MRKKEREGGREGEGRGEGYLVVFYAHCHHESVKADHVPLKVDVFNCGVNALHLVW